MDRNQTEKQKLIKRIQRGLSAALLLLTVGCMVTGAVLDRQEKPDKASAWVWITQETEHCILRSYLPILAFTGEGGDLGTGTAGVHQFVIDSVEQMLPWYYYTGKENEDIVELCDAQTTDLLIRQEGSDEEQKNIEESRLDYDESALHISEDRIAQMQEENGAWLKENQDNSLDIENQGEADQTIFQAAQYPAYTYDWSEKWDYQKLVDNFYAIDQNTESDEKQLNLEELLNQDMGLEQQKAEEGEPQILIYHTHSQEAFADSIPGDDSTTIVGVGERLSELLHDTYGFQVLHHTGQYDVEERDYAYSMALPEIEKILEEYPSIEVVIDLHRDEMKEGRKLVIDLQGRPTARFMFFNGLSHTTEGGDIDYLENPYIQENLAFSFQAQTLANEYYPGIARKIYLKSYRYNMHLRAKFLLIELGAQTNTVEEIYNACDPLAHVLAMLLSGKTDTLLIP